MDCDESVQSAVMDAVVRCLRETKSRILEGTRPDRDYPMSLPALSDALREICTTDPGAILPSDADPSDSEQLIDHVVGSILEAAVWDDARIGRRTVRTKTGETHLFYLPGDEHFIERPKTQGEYVTMLFALERRSASAAASRDADARSGNLPDRSAFGSEFRTAYDRLIRITRGASYVKLTALRREVSVPREDFDREVLRLRDRGEIILCKHGYPADLSAEERAEGIEMSPGEYYYYVLMPHHTACVSPVDRVD